MSLIVARKIEGKIVVAGDTRITNLTSGQPRKPTEGLAKIRFFNSDIIFAFAGNPDIIPQILSKVDPSTDFATIQDVLLEQREQYERKVDFIIGSISRSKLFSLKDDNWEDVEHCWVGSGDAFVTLRGFETGHIQETFLNTTLQNSAIFVTMRQMEEVSEEAGARVNNFVNSFINLVEKTSITDVGDFCIVFVQEFGKFRPLNYTIMRNNNLVLPPQLGEEPQIVPAGTVEDGSHAFEFMHIDSDHGYAGFYLLQGRLGILFPIGINDFNTKTFETENSIDFEYQVQSSLGVNVRSSFSNTQLFLAVGLAALNIERNFEKAFWIFKQGTSITRPEDPYYKFILAYRGLLSAIFGDDKSALDDCNSAIDSEAFKIQVHECRGNVHQIASRFKDAIADFEVVINEDPNLGLIYQRLAECHGALGDAVKSAEYSLLRLKYR